MTDDQHAQENVSRMHARDRAAAAAGITVVDAGAGHATVAMAVTGDLLNGHGTCHGGYLFLLADVAFSYACNSGGVLNVAAAADITYVAPVTEGATLQATAVRRLRFGRDDRHGFYDVTVTAGDDLVAVFTGRARQIG